MTFLTKPSELKSPVTIKGLILGDTNNGKTTLALSSPEPVLIDFENGLHRVSKQWQTISMQCKNFEDFLDFLNSKEIKQFKTIVMDPLGELADQIKACVIKRNPALVKDSRKLYPVIASEFKNIWTILKGKGLSILFVSHADEEKKDDVDALKIRCEGTFIKNFLPTQMDFVTILRREDSNGKTKRFLDFQKNKSFAIAKRFEGLEDMIEVPTIRGNNNFLEDVIWKAWREKGEREEALNLKFNTLIEELKDKIVSIPDKDHLNDYYTACYHQHEEFLSSYMVEEEFVRNKAKELKCEFDTSSKQFKLKELTATAGANHV